METLAGCDPRVWQIGVLSALLAAQLGWLDFGASAWQAAVTIGGTFATQALACRVLARRFEWRSPLITGLSLSLLLRSHELAMWAMAGMVEKGRRRVHPARRPHEQQHNDREAGGVEQVLGLGIAGQWGAMAWSALLLGGGGALVLPGRRAP